MPTDSPKNSPENVNSPENSANARRDALKKIALGSAAIAAGAFGGFVSREEKILAAQLDADSPQTETSAAPQAAENATAAKPDAVSGATRTSFDVPKRAELVEKIPLSQIGELKLSRVFLGGNLIGGWAHSRDLIYVSDLVKAYHTKNKVFETFYIAEECGINAFLGHTSLQDMVADYWKWTDGKIQYIADCGDDPETIRRAIDKGAAGCYIQGETTDRLVREGKFDLLEKCFTTIKDGGVVAGIGAHRIETLRAVVDAGIAPDFWMKTYHPLNYWSARHPQEHDNVFCRRPDETREFMESRPEPWIAFKVLAAGALRPAEGFRYAFEGGADFLCVGMYDFQIIDNVNTAVDVLKSNPTRTRPWRTEDVERVDETEEEDV